MTTPWSACRTYDEFREVARSAPDAFEVAVEALKTFVGANFTGHIGTLPHFSSWFFTMTILERLEESKQYVPSFLLSEAQNARVAEDLSLNLNSPHPSARYASSVVRETPIPSSFGSCLTLLCDGVSLH